MEIIGKIFLVIWKIIKWLFATSWFLTLLLFALLDLWLGDGSWWRSLTAKNTGRGRDTENEIITKIQKEIPQATNEEVLEKYGKNLENYVQSKPTISIEARIFEKIRNSPGKLIEEILSPEEMEILFVMILRAYGLI